MARLFTSLVILNIAMLAASAGFGYLIDTPASLSIHTLLGILTVLVAVLTQSVGFTYFLGTGRWVKEATLAHGLDMGYHRRSAVLKRHATFVSLGAMFAVVLIAWLGGMVAAAWHVPRWTHAAAVWTAGPLYVVLCVWEIRLIRANLDMLDKCVVAVKRAEAHRVPAPAVGATDPRDP